MRKLDPEKLAALSSFNDELDRLHGKPGTPSRQQFDEESIAAILGIQFVPTFMTAMR